MNISPKLASKILILTAVVLGVVFAIPAMAQTNASSIKRACTQEAKQCPDGSYVSRTGPNCEFAACPGTTIKEKRAELNTKLKDERDAAKKRLETVREETKKATEALRVEFKDKISKLRDERKKQIATRLDKQLAHLNTQWTDHFNDVLNRLSEILSKVELRADKAQTNGRNVSTVKTAIGNAKTAIESARTAVRTQAKKTYIVTFSSEKELGTAFKAVREQLKKDLFGLRDGAMKSAREAVQNALQALKGVQKVNEEK